MAKSATPIRSEKDLPKMLISEPRLFPRIADLELRRGSAKAAAKIVVKGLQQIPDSVSGWLVKGSLHLQLRQAKLARTAFEKALQIDQDVPSAHRQCADLAAEEGDQEGYLFHLRHLARLESLDENVQSMLQTALLREAAVKTGIYSRESVSRVMPGTLRQALLRAGALPEEIARRAERYEFASDSPGSGDAEDDGRTHTEDTPGREKLAWEGPEAEEKIRRPEKETKDRYVRVSWADAVTDETTRPLVEIGPEQFEQSEEEERASLSDLADGKRPTGIQEPPPAEVPAAAVSGPNEPAFEHEPMVRPYVHRPTKPEPVAPPQEEIPAVDIEDEWVGATPQPPEIEIPKPQPAPPPPPPPEPPQTAAPAHSRFRLPPDMVLPERRPLELDEDVQPQSRSRVFRASSSADSEPPRPEKTQVEAPAPQAEPRATSTPSRTRFPETPVAPPSMVERLSQSAEAGKPPRDDSSIMRLLGSEREKKPSPPKAPISQLLTKFDIDEAPAERPVQSKPTEAPSRKIAEPPRMETSDTPVESPESTPNAEEPEAVVTAPSPQIAKVEPKTVAAPAVKPEPEAEEDAPLSKPPEVIAREEEARGKLAAIAQEVTGKPVPTAALKAPSPTRPVPPPTPAPAAASDSKEGDGKGKAKIATKTLAELYASQGDWTRAVEVYEALLEKFPTNEAYARRLESLRSKLTDN